MNKISRNLSYVEIKEELGFPEDFVKRILEKKESTPSVYSRAFFSIYTFFTGIFVVPVLGILGPTLFLCAFLTPIMGLIKFVAFLLNIEVPFLSFYLISFELHPLLAFPFTLLFGIFFFFLGKRCLKLLKQYLNHIKRMHEALS